MADAALPDALTVPPFPPLAWDEYFWTGKDRFPEWDAFQNRGGPYGSVAAKTPTPRVASVSVNPSNRDARSAPTAGQLAAYAHLKANGPAIVQAILAAVLAEYPAWRESYRHAIDDFEELMPDVSDADELRPLIGLGTVHVLNVARDNVAYVGFELGCTWDEEHGVGVMTHAGRVVDAGGADTSFLDWVAERDGGKAI